MFTLSIIIKLSVQVLHFVNETIIKHGSKVTGLEICFPTICHSTPLPIVQQINSHLEGIVHFMVHA